MLVLAQLINGRRLLNIMYNNVTQLICCDMSKIETGPSFTFNRDGIGQSWIDHIFLSANLINDVQQCGVVSEHVLNVSDHLPVALTLNLQTDKTDSTLPLGDVVAGCRVRWHKLSEEVIQEKYTNKTDMCMQDLKLQIANGNINSDVDQLCDVITSRLVSVSEKELCKPKRAVGTKSRPFWSKELSDLVRIKKVAYDNWNNSGRPRDPTNPIFVHHKQSKCESTRSKAQT